MNKLTKIIFCGSTTDSVIVLEQLTKLAVSRWRLVAVITQPPRPVGREQAITPTPVATWATKHNILTLTFTHNPEKPWLFADEQQVAATLSPFQADLIISASFGQKIPWPAIQSAKYGGLNIHPSLLPRWRGADPVPWAILTGDHQTGVSVVTLSEKFDQGTVITQKKVPITAKDFSDPLRTRLFTIGAKLLVEALLKYLSSQSLRVPSQAGRGNPVTDEIASPSERSRNDNRYARKFNRDDGFEPWTGLMAAGENPEEATRIDRKYRALHPWPGLWTLMRLKDGSEKRLKILELKLTKLPPHRRAGETPGLKLDLLAVQLEGKKPVSFREFTRAYMS